METIVNTYDVNAIFPACFWKVNLLSSKELSLAFPDLKLFNN